MSKRLISVMLALVMVLSVFSVSAFAAVNVEYETFDEEAGETEVAYTQAWSLVTTNEADANGKYTVDVCLETNYLVGAISFSVVAEGATLEAVTASDEILDVDGYNGDVQVNLSKGNVYIVPQPVNEAAEGLNLETSTVIATLTFALNAESATVTLNNDAKTVDNAGKLIAVRLSDATLASGTMYYGQRVIDAEGNDVELGAEISSVVLGEEVAAEPQLVAADGYEDIVIDTNKTFGGAYAGTIYGFSGTSFRAATYLTTQLKAIDGTIATVQTPYNTVRTFGTGATVQLKNLDGEVVATYVVVIFGDVDCNGTITATDVQKMVNFNKGLTTIPANPIHLAAQLFCTNAGTGRALNASDVGKFVNFNKGTETISQADLAAKHATFTDARNYGSSYVMAS